MAALLQRRRLQLGGHLPTLAIQCQQAKAAIHSESSDDFSSGSRSPLEGFELLGLLGQGTTSCVRKGYRKSDKLPVAIKTMRTDDTEMTSVAEGEYALLKRLSHPNIIRAVDCFSLPGKTLTVLEYFDGCELSEAIINAPGDYFPESVARHLSKELFGAVRYLHEQGVLHRDIKPENVLVNRTHSQLKLLDFNSACCLRTSVPLTPAGTKFYAAPEVLQGGSPCQSSDVWGAGLCTYLMLCGKLPQRRDTALGCSPTQIATRSITLTSPAWQSVSQPCKDVVLSSLALQPVERPSAEGLLAMEWLLGSSSQTEEMEENAVKSEGTRTDALEEADGQQVLAADVSPSATSDFAATFSCASSVKKTLSASPSMVTAATTSELGREDDEVDSESLTERRPSPPSPTSSALSPSKREDQDHFGTRISSSLAWAFAVPDSAPRGLGMSLVPMRSSDIKLAQTTSSSVVAPTH